MVSNQNKPTIFIVHGTKGNPNAHWFPWLKSKLEDKGFEVILEQYPTPENQNVESWLAVLEKHNKKINHDTIFVGHSIAALFFLHYLERNNKQIAGVYVAGAFLEVSVNEEYDTLNKTFMKKDFDFEKIKSNCKDFFVFHSKDDPYVPIEKGREYAEKVNGQFIEYENAGHFNDEAGYTEFEDLLQIIIKNNNLAHWCNTKQHIECSNTMLNIRIRGVYWVSVGENIGYEQNGKNKNFERPVLVVRVFNKNMFFGVPLTSARKNKKSNYYFSLMHKGKEYFAILPQARLFSTKRILRFIRKIEISEFKELKDQLRDVLRLQDE